MMGVGKSTVGPALAELLERSYLDADREIERREGRSIPDLFSERGEAGFRKAEREAIEALAGERLVVALGGGAICQPGASELLSKTGCVVYLKARVETLLARIGNDGGRPLLADLSREGRLARLTELLEERSEAYESAAISADTETGDAAAIARAVVRELEGRPL
jgi:shikimate kinase